ncbi:unnamed protein product, partial [Chrysoparadoxa australica]
HWEVALACSHALTLRVRLIDGAVRRISVAGGDTLQSIKDQLVMGEDEGLATDSSKQGGDDNSKTVNELGLSNGDFLYAKRCQAKAALQAKLKEERLQAAKSKLKQSQAPADVWHPFPKLARPPPPKGAAKNWQDLEALSAQTFTVKPQKKGQVEKVSVEEGCLEAFMSDLQVSSRQLVHRCALLFGTVNEAAKTVKVQAMYEAPPGAADDAMHDPSALLHFLSARDLATAAALQLRAMKEIGRDAGAYSVTVTVPVNATTGEIATEAYGVSDLAVQMCSDGVFVEPMEQSDPGADTVQTKVEVNEAGKPTKAPEVLGLLTNVAIVQHKGSLVTRFPQMSTNPGPSDLSSCLFASGGQTGKRKKLSFRKRLSDFNLLIYLSKKLGMGSDFEALCRCVKDKGKGEGSAEELERYKVVLRALCEQ